MMRLLLVEDELEIQSFVRQSLTGAGYEVHTAEDGNTAAILAAKHVYQGMIVDLGLPDQDGIDLILQLWKSGVTSPAMLVFVMLHRFVASDIQRRSDAWLSGEVGVLGDVAGRTPKGRLYRRVVGEVAELASREIPNRQRSSGHENDAVFFLQAGDSGPAKLWVGSGDGAANLAAIRSIRVLRDVVLRWFRTVWAVFDRTMVVYWSCDV